MTDRETMLEKLAASKGAAEFAASLTPEERAAINRDDLQPSPWRTYDPLYTGRDGMGRLTRTPLRPEAMGAHGLTPPGPLEVLDFLVTDETNHLRAQGLLP